LVFARSQERRTGVSFHSISVPCTSAPSSRKTKDLDSTLFEKYGFSAKC
jgi:hypothetical protein